MKAIGSRRNGIWWATAALALIGGIGAARAQDYGELTLVNQTSATLDVYYDGTYGCRALGGLTCSTQVPAGDHNLLAKADNGSTATGSMTLSAGSTYTWTITEQQ